MQHAYWAISRSSRHALQELNITGRPKSDFYDGPGPLTEEVAIATQSLPARVNALGLYRHQYGPEEIYCGSAGHHQGCIFSNSRRPILLPPQDLSPSHYLHDRAKVSVGIPLLRELDWLNWVPQLRPSLLQPHRADEGPRCAHHP